MWFDSSQNLTSIGIAERNGSGHRLVYVSHLLEEALASNNEFVYLICTPAVVESREFEMQLSWVLESAVQVIVHSGPWTLRWLDSFARSNGLDVLIIPDGDVLAAERLLHPWSSARNTTFLIMRDPRVEFKNGLSKRTPASILKVLVWRAVNLLPRSRALMLVAPGVHVGKLEVCDPVELGASSTEIAQEVQEIRQTLGLDPSKFWFGVVGVLADRKLSAELLDAIKVSAMDSQQKVGLILAGPIPAGSQWPFSNEFRTLGSVVDLVVHEKYLTNREMSEIVGAVDCVIGAYSGETHTPSSTLAKASALGTRAIGSGPKSFLRQISDLPNVVAIPFATTQLAGALEVSMRSARPSPAILPGAQEFARKLLGGG